MANSNLDQAIARFGVPAKMEDREAIIALLKEQIELEEVEEGDQELMRFLCGLLCTIGVVEDSLLIWDAKTCNFDTSLGIDVQFMCGAGIHQTKDFLLNAGEHEAVEYMDTCPIFEKWKPEDEVAELKRYYGC